MKPEDDAKKILEEFMSRASGEEANFLLSELKKLRKKQGVFSQINLTESARDIASVIESRFSLDSGSIHRSARTILANMLRDRIPGISDRDIEILLNLWVPDGNKKSRLPLDMLHVMVQHFVAHGLGRFSQEDLKEFPEGWEKKYWEAFPAAVQALISRVLKREIGEDLFWQEIGKCLLRESEKE